MPIGVDDFKKVIENYYFVDKSDFIKDVIDCHAEATLITRPRRFGKTLNLSMLDYYFSVEKKDESKKLFENLKISQFGEKYLSEKNKYPVIFLSLKEIAGTNWAEMQEYIAYFLARLFMQFDKLQKEMNIQQEKDYFEKIKSQKGNIAENANSLKILTELLERFYQEKVIVLIDEYDAPIQKAKDNNYYTQAISFFREFYGNALKGNKSLHFAVMTGVLRITKESIFSGLNNVDICSITSERYNSAFGFKQGEIERICNDLGLKNKQKEIKKWYDGYYFGEIAIYNPWSVICYIANNCIAKPYWINTSGNSVLNELPLSTPDEIEKLRDLLNNQKLTISLNEGLVYSDIGKELKNIYTLLLLTGYLTIATNSKINRDRCFVKIPNEEIKWAFSKEILDRLIEGVNKGAFDDLYESVIKGNTSKFQEILQMILLKIVSCYDVANKEGFYHGLLLGMTAMAIDGNYKIASNKESGKGRYDIALVPQNRKGPAIIMELKVVNSEAELEKSANEGLNQIEEKEYDADIKGAKVTNIWKYGIAFYKKSVCIKVQA